MKKIALAISIVVTMGVASFEASSQSTNDVDENGEIIIPMGDPICVPLPHDPKCCKTNNGDGPMVCS